MFSLQKHTDSNFQKIKIRLTNLIKNIINKKIDAVTFTSTLTVQNLLEIAKEEEKERLLEEFRNGNVAVAAIGPVTARPLKNMEFLF